MTLSNLCRGSNRRRRKAASFNTIGMFLSLTKKKRSTKQKKQKITVFHRLQWNASLLLTLDDFTFDRSNVHAHCRLQQVLKVHRMEKNKTTFAEKGFYF